MSISFFRGLDLVVGALLLVIVVVGVCRRCTTPAEATLPKSPSLCGVSKMGELS
ncbi:hypothetical protein PYWP30_02025 [Pyrobaculum sp. WP30]|nr:hypothetical protein PYWP30_02025 [Pyrobaculum sp. WP30]